MLSYIFGVYIGLSLGFWLFFIASDMLLPADLRAPRWWYPPLAAFGWPYFLPLALLGKL